ncbi:hypothetical protein D3879_23340 [Pseudomonas cavernicola]|uniref:DUF2937 domain-containing protein n=1 Tax=Pseudomonas cavernicola TaxID=2320866 RepID=A0A418X8H0_9PSED|nr:hypothetical protein [Pseudomonas cavernicola]RJG08802.1 hypothetical protein D3879_23340 [Pseudomonas cavernicola]
MRIGGWSRLWVVITVLYGVVVAFVAYDERPTLEQLQYNWVRDASDIMAEAISRTEKVELSGLKLREMVFAEKTDAEAITTLEEIATSPTENQRLFSSKVAKVNEKHRQIVSQLGAVRGMHVLLSLAWWLGPSLMLLALGWSAGWVFRGFRGKSV